MDKNLNWKSEISHVANKFANSIGIKSRCSFFLPKSSLRMLSYSLIYPYFYYCNIVWASTFETNLRRLVILQKHIIRIINKSHFNSHTDPIFKNLGMLKFNDIHLLQLGQFMYSCKNSFLPSSSLRADEIKLWLTLSAKQRRNPCSGLPAVYPDLSARHDWPVKKGLCFVCCDRQSG